MKYGCIYELTQDRFAACMESWSPYKRSNPQEYRERTPVQQELWRKQVAVEILKRRCDLVVDIDDVILWDDHRRDMKCIRVKFHRGPYYLTSIPPCPEGCEFMRIGDCDDPDRWPDLSRYNAYPEQPQWGGQFG